VFAGKQFGKWTVLEMLGIDNTGHRLVRCRCECIKSWENL